MPGNCTNISGWASDENDLCWQVVIGLAKRWAGL